MRFRQLSLVLVVAAAAACDDNRENQAPEISAAVTPGVYAGQFPCGDCPGIAARLWLRPDGRFFFKQQYAADDRADATTAYNFGRWSSIADGAGIELRGAGPQRVFRHVDRDTLLMQTYSELEHRLTREPVTSEFTATVTMEGNMRFTGNAVSFTECLTGLVAPVSQGGDFRRFQHQYRGVGGRGDAAFVEFEGRFAWSGDGAVESVTIERFVTIKAEGEC